jgi:hypothetical protein
MRVLVLLAALVSGINAAYVVGYHQGLSETEIVNAGKSFSAPVSADQIADIYSRLSGLPPLLWEGKE